MEQREIEILVEELLVNDEVIGADITVFEKVDGVNETLEGTKFISESDNFALYVFEKRCYYEDVEGCGVHINW